MNFADRSRLSPSMAGERMRNRKAKVIKGLMMKPVPIHLSRVEQV